MRTPNVPRLKCVPKSWTPTTALYNEARLYQAIIVEICFIAGMHGDDRKKSLYVQVTSKDSGLVFILLESGILNVIKM